MAISGGDIKSQYELCLIDLERIYQKTSKTCYLFTHKIFSKKLLIMLGTLTATLKSDVEEHLRKRFLTA